MPTLNADLPRHLYVWVRREHLYDLRSHHGEYVEAVAFAVSSMPGRALGFHVHVRDGGGVYSGVPVHALCAQPFEAPARSLPELQTWDCFGPELSVHQYTYLADMGCVVALGASAPGSARVTAPGRYLCTVDWWGNGYSDEPSQRKCLHLIQLDEGNFALVPNNRVMFNELSYTRDFGTRPDWCVNSRTWWAEDTPVSPIATNLTHDADAPPALDLVSGVDWINAKPTTES